MPKLGHFSKERKRIGPRDTPQLRQLLDNERKRRSLGVMSETKQLLSTKQTADLLRCDLRTVHRLVERGDLSPAHKLDGKTGAYLFDPDVVAERVKAREVAS
jgi:hypothetical protein